MRRDTASNVNELAKQLVVRFLSSSSSSPSPVHSDSNACGDHLFPGAQALRFVHSLHVPCIVVTKTTLSGFVPLVSDLQKVKKDLW